LLTSRWIVTRRMPTPNRTSVDGTIGRGATPVVPTWASAAIIVKATASTKQRAPIRMATAALPRTAELRGMEHVKHHPARAQMRAHRDIGGRGAHAEHAVMRATERGHRAREADGQPRGDHDERRAPRGAAPPAGGPRPRPNPPL